MTHCTKEQLQAIQNVKSQVDMPEKEKNLLLARLIHKIKVPITIIQNTLNLYYKRYKAKAHSDLHTIKSIMETLIRDMSNIPDIEKITHTQHLYNHTTVLNISNSVEKVDQFACGVTLLRFKF